MWRIQHTGKFSFGEIKEFIYSYADVPTKYILRDTDYLNNLTA